jgi:muconolactone delta-isomerase
VDYLVTMTTHVPDGTTDVDVADMRSREAARSETLAQEGHLLRLWRPPLLPGQWRTLGLFRAADRAALEEVLLSMPLRAWRTDEVLALEPHPNDPGPRTRAAPSAPTTTDGNEFLTTFVVTFPPETTTATVAAAEAREAEQAQALAAQGVLIRLWATEGAGHALGLWRAGNIEEIHEFVESLPLRPWLAVETVALAPHPSDPALA